MSITRRLFLRNTAAAGTAVAIAAPAVAAEPEMTPREKAIRHMRELERLVSEDGGKRVMVMAVADYSDDTSYRGVRAIAINDGRFDNKDGMFAPKGGEM